MNRQFNKYFNHVELRLKRQSTLNEILFTKRGHHGYGSKADKRLQRLRLELELIERELVSLAL